MLVVKEGMNQLGYGKDCGIKVKGLGIREVHCGVQNQGDSKVVLRPMNDSRTLVNGRFLAQDTQIYHGDRIVLGHGNAWRMIIPALAGEERKEDEASGWLGYGDIMEDRLNSDTPEARNIRKYLDELKERLGEVKTRKFVELFK